ncbi:MAG: glycoside hydrolase family 43 protein [Bacteroidia bacterium]
MRILFFVILAFITNKTFSQENTFTNPILPGSHPDPSICFDGEYFYIVNSTFEIYPGLPIHKSKDLINWELIGYGLHRESQCSGAVNLVDVQSDGGIHAPTIRYNNGLFHIITTNVYYNEETKKTDFVNFIITAENAAGPWSEPHVLEGAPGIDPDIFFDDDGKVWYVGTHSPDNPNFSGEGEIWLQQIDLENWRLVGERSYLWRGACGGVWAEGPHMYKRNGFYYLMIAEGGTSFNHAVMIAVSDNIKGPFISNDRNPIFTTRHL